MAVSKHTDHNIMRSRNAFTLVELLVVIAIIGLIAGLTAAAAVAVMSQQKSSNTEWLVKTVATALDQHWRSVVESARQEPPSLYEMNLSQDSTLNKDSRRAQVIHIKLRLMSEFPQNFTEALSPPAAVDTYFQDALAGMGVTGGQGPPRVASQPGDTTEAAVCLLLTLQKKRKGVTFDLNSLNTAIGDGMYPDPANGLVRIKQLIDAYGTPLNFYRWPTANTELDGLNPNKSDPRYGPAPTFGGFQDTLDTDGTLLMPAWWSGSNRTTFELKCHSLSKSVGGTTIPYAYFTLPTIVSAGRNQQFEIARQAAGVPDPMAPSLDPVTGLPIPSDDILSFRLLSLTARGD
jgi:prepilin-type N-terminal cleavage/methylation domain-containing protein